MTGSGRTIRRLAMLGGLLGAALGAGCSPIPVTEVLLEPDPARDGAEGLDGPFGAALYTERTLARVDDLVRYEVVLPEGDGLADELPVVVMIHGGFVEVRRYRWLGVHLASRGYVTVMADHDANLSFLSSANSTAALDDVLAESARPGHPLQGRLNPAAPASVVGHSLGGVAAATLWAEDPDRWDVLGIFASFPAGNTDVEQWDGRPSLHLVGSEDEPEVKRERGFARFNEPRVFGVIDGMNHFAWTDEASEQDLTRDEPALRPDEETRQAAMHVLDTSLDAWMLDDPLARERLDAADFSGAEVER